MYGKDNTYTLDEVENDERLQQDCKYVANIKKSIRDTYIHRLEEMKNEFIKTNQIDEEEQYFTQKVFEFLKSKA
jgi:hypothetical protein